MPHTGGLALRELSKDKLLELREIHVRHGLEPVLRGQAPRNALAKCRECGTGDARSACLRPPAAANPREELVPQASTHELATGCVPLAAWGYAAAAPYAHDLHGFSRPLASRYTKQRPRLFGRTYFVMRVIFAFILSISLAFSLTAHAQLVSSTTRPMLAIYDTDAGRTAEVGNLAGNSAGMRLTTSRTVTVPGVGSAAPFAGVDLDSFRDEQDVRSAFTTWVGADNRPPLADLIHAYMRDYGLSQAWYRFERTGVELDAGDFTVSWSMFVDADGRASFGAPKVMMTDPADERYLRVRYEMAAVPPGLVLHIGPGDLNPNAGMLVWQLLDADGIPLPGAGTNGVIDVNGAFDFPLEGPVNISAELEVLVESAVVQNLLSTTGSKLSQLEYVYSPEARYALAPAAVCGGSSCRAPSGTWDYDARELEYVDCGRKAVYRNDGSYRLDLEHVTDSYAVDPETLEVRLVDRQVQHTKGRRTEFHGNRDLTLSQAASVQASGNRLVLSPLMDGALIDSRILVGEYLPVALNVEGEASQGPEKPTFDAPEEVGPGETFTLTWAPQGCIVPSRYELRVEAVTGNRTVYSGSGRSTSFTADGAPEYTFRLRACDASQCSDWVEDLVTVCGFTPPYFLGPQHQRINVGSGGGNIGVMWASDSCVEPDYYVVEVNPWHIGWRDWYTGPATSRTYENNRSLEIDFRVKSCLNSGECTDWSWTKDVLVCNGPCL